MQVWLPQGSEALRYYAIRRRFAYDGCPTGDFFTKFEPHDSLVSPEKYYNAVTAPAPWGGTITLAEPWTAGDGLEPIERTVIAFALIDKLRTRAAMRVGETFMTRVAFLGSTPPKQVPLGDAVWDEHVTTFAPDSETAARAFPRSVRSLLRRRGFCGQLEMRPGAMVVYEAERLPTPDDYEALLILTIELGKARLTRG